MNPVMRFGHLRQSLPVHADGGIDYENLGRHIDAW